MQRLKAEGFDLVGSPDILGAGKAVLPGGEGGLLITSLAPGKGLDDFMDIGILSGQPRVDAFDNLKNAITKNAEALAELHTKPLGSGGPVASEYLDQHVKALKEITDKIQSNPKFSDIPDISQLREQLDTKVDDLIKGLKQNPGGSALVHGDAHPGNFFYDPEKGITLIDTPTLHSSMDAMGNPIGTPARDFGNFDQKLANLGDRFNLKPDEITELQATFRRSYQLAGGPPLSNESLSFFRTRAALGELSKFNEIAGSDATPQEIKAVGARLFELAMKALGN